MNNIKHFGYTSIRITIPLNNSVIIKPELYFEQRDVIQFLEIHSIAKRIVIELAFLKPEPVTSAFQIIESLASQINMNLDQACLKEVSFGIEAETANDSKEYLQYFIPPTGTNIELFDESALRFRSRHQKTVGFVIATDPNKLIIDRAFTGLRIKAQELGDENLFNQFLCKFSHYISQIIPKTMRTPSVDAITSKSELQQYLMGQFLKSEDLQKMAGKIESNYRDKKISPGSVDRLRQLFKHSSAVDDDKLQELHAIRETVSDVSYPSSVHIHLTEVGEPA